MKWHGKTFLLKIEDPETPGLFQTIAGQRSTGKTISSDFIEINTKDDSRWRKMLRHDDRVALKIMTMQSSGLIESFETHRLLVQLAETGQTHKFQIILANGITITQRMFVQVFEGSAEYTDAQQFSITLHSVGDDPILDLIPDVITFDLTTITWDSTVITFDDGLPL